MDAYETAAQTWRSIFENAHPVGWTSPWVDETWRDGNPVFSAWSRPLRKGLRIIQHSEPCKLAVWVSVYAQGEPEEIRELVISCALNAESLEIAKQRIAEWTS